MVSFGFEIMQSSYTTYSGHYFINYIRRHKNEKTNYIVG